MRGAWVLLVGAMVFLSSCSDSPAERATVLAATPAEASPAGSAGTEIDAAYQASGPIVVENQIDITAQREGVLASIAADAGARVRKGQMLAALDDRQLQADRAAAVAKTRSLEAEMKTWESEVKVLQADLERDQQMWDARIISKQQLDHTRFKVEADQYDVERVRQNLVNAQESLKSLDLELEKTRFRAPFDGIVARRYVRLGQRVAPGDRIFWVSAESPLRVRFTLPGEYLGRVREGDKVPVNVGGRATTYSARVVQVMPIVDPSSGTIEVLAELLGSTAGLKPGMMASIRLERP